MVPVAIGFLSLVLLAEQTGAAVPDAIGEATRGATLAREGKYDLAIEHYKAALRLNAQLPGLQLNLGLAYFKSKHLPEAAAAFEEAVRSDNTSVQARTLLGMSYYGAGRYREAAAQLKLVAEAQPDNIELRYTLAQSYLWAEEYPEALREFQFLLSKNPDSAPVHILLGEALDASNRTEAATVEFEAAVKASPVPPDAHFGLGYLYWKQRRYEEACREFEAELATQPQHAQALTYLGDTEMQAGRNQAAEAHLRSALALDANMRLAHLDLGIVLAAKNDSDAAARHFREAIRIDPSQPDAHYRLGRLWSSLGRQQEAEVEFEKVKTLATEKASPPLVRLPRAAAPVNLSPKFASCVCAMALAIACAMVSGQSAPSPIHFTYQPIGFRLDSCETLHRHAPETMAGGVAVFDYNNDGYLDIFFTNGADILSLKKTSAKYSNRLFENDGKGHFTDVTARAGLGGTGFDVGVATGDYDNDGREDIFVGGVHGNHLYHNDGGTFTDVTAKAGLAAPDPQYGPLWSVGGAWVDVNNDGLLDLLVVNYLAWDPKTEPSCEAAPGQLDYCHPKFYKPTANQLFRNNGDGTFRDISEESGIRAHPGKGMGIGVADYDQDGLMDFFIANDKMNNSLFHNKGGGRFEEIAFQAGVALTEDGKFISGMGVDARDIYNDGLPDIVFAALDGETFPFFRNLGKRGFADATRSSGLARLTLPMAGYSPTIADFDNDGWKDIFFTRGHVQALGSGSKVQVDQPNTVFRNLGGAKFQALTEEAGLSAQPPARHRGSAVGDLNGDGRLDVVTTALSAPAELWLNDSGDAHWLELKLEGTASNRDGIGARIKVTAGGRVQYNHVSFAAGYASSTAAPTHFGLGPAASASLIEIRWPSGIAQELKDVAADRVIRVKEPSRN